MQAQLNRHGDRHTDRQAGRQAGRQASGETSSFEEMETNLNFRGIGKKLDVCGSDKIPRACRFGPMWLSACAFRRG